MNIILFLCSSIHIIFNRFDVELTDSCDSDYVEIQFWNETRNTWTRVGDRACGRTLPPAITSPTGRTRVIFKSNRAVNGDGFSLGWELGCGGVLTAREGSLTSPGYPEKYANNLYCNYTILVPGQDFVVASFVENFDVSSFMTCMIKTHKKHLYQKRPQSGCNSTIKTLFYSSFALALQLCIIESRPLQ